MDKSVLDVLVSKFPEIKKEDWKKTLDLSVQNRIAAVSKLLGHENEAKTSELLAEQLEIPFVKSFEIEKTYFKVIPVKIFTSHGILPIVDPSGQNNLCLACCWPLDEKICKQIEIFCGKNPEVYLGIPTNITYETGIFFGFEKNNDEVHQTVIQTTDSEINVEESEAEVVKFVNDIVRRAIKSRATDIHFEPQRNTLKVRYRIDGDLVFVRTPENLVRFQSAIVSRLKIMAGLNISEKRRPQDGKISFREGQDHIDIRISTLPVVHGESVSLRLLVQGGNAPVSLRDLNMSDYQLEVSKKALSKPHGIVLLTGPTGSGKSTTLSSFLRHLYSPTIRLMTVEDPVEYEIAGVNQSQVHPEIGLTFATVLRSLLRQDPDVIMIGEIRDGETADIAVRAAVTGHLVLSTLHTNDAVGTITRLKDIGIEPYMIASSLEMVCAQRLVRRVCPHCAVVSEKLNTSQEITELRKVFSVTENLTDIKFMEPVGCEHCNGTGYRGRMAVFEVLGMNERIHEAIVRGATESEIRKLAVQDGMTFLAQDAFLRACKGLTTIEEAFPLIP